MNNNRDEQKQSFISSMLSAYGLLALAILILTAPDFYHHTKEFIWAFLSSRYAASLVPIAFVAFYGVAYPALYFVMKTGWQTPVGLAVIWIADKIF